MLPCGGVSNKHCLFSPFFIAYIKTKAQISWGGTVQLQVEWVTGDPEPLPQFLAHLSRRLIGELLVYRGIRRPSVVRRLSTFSNDISSEAAGPILLIFHI